MIRAVTFDKQLMRSEDFAHQVNYFYQGKMGVSKGCEVSTDTNGNIVVSDGYFSIYGRLLRNVGDTVVEVPTIPSGELYSILVFEVDLSKENSIDEFRQGEFKIVSSTSGYPSLTQQNLDDGGTIYQLEFCRFINTTNGITSFKDTRTILSLGMYTLQDDFEAHISESSKMHITESGSNVNGRYIKFDDGTAICWHLLNVEYADSATLLKTWYFPILMPGSIPRVFPVKRNVLTLEKRRGSCYSSTPDETGAVVGIAAADPVFDSSTTHAVHVLAIGRWKV